MSTLNPVADNTLIATGSEEASLGERLPLYQAVLIWILLATASWGILLSAASLLF